MNDYKHTNKGDIDLATGDLVVAESTDQHQSDILVADKGHYKESPSVGVGIVNFIHDTEPENLLRRLRQECTKDGMKVKRVELKAGEINIDASYEGS